MKDTKTLIGIYLKGIPGGLGDLKRLFPNRPASVKELLRCLQPKPEDLADPEFFNASTTIMFYMIVRAIVQIANHDEIGRFTAGNIPDGTVVLSIADGPAGSLHVKDHAFSCSTQAPEVYHAIMEFKDMALARELFEGKVSALACVGRGLVSMRGNLGMLDNINRLLDRVAVYLG
jgi:hypothetical protein